MERIDYVAVAKWPKGQVPVESEAAKLPSSFKVTSADAKPAAKTKDKAADKPAQHDASPVAHSKSGAPAQPSTTPHPGAASPTGGSGGISKAQLLALARSAGSTVAPVPPLPCAPLAAIRPPW